MGSHIEGTIHIPLLSVCMCIVLIARPIISFNQTKDLVSRKPSYKRSEKIYPLNPENSNLVSSGLGIRLEVGYIYLVLEHVGDPHSSPGELVFFLRVIDHRRRPNISQELSQPFSMSYHF